MGKKRILIISAVLPFPGNSGQQQRVLNTVLALKNHFHVSFLTYANSNNSEMIFSELSEMCDEAIVLSSRYSKSIFTKLFYRIIGAFFMIFTSLKFSNFIVDKVELSPNRIEKSLKNKIFDCVFFEYWHAESSIKYFHKRDVSCVLDMHNILWQSYSEVLKRKWLLPNFVKKFVLKKYRKHEEKAWAKFDGIIAINSTEFEYVKRKISDKKWLNLTFMGIDKSKWNGIWENPKTPQIAYYGGLGSEHNKNSALFVHDEIMPKIWVEFPEAKYWIIGSNPPDEIKDLTKDSRIGVTGFVEDVAQLLTQMSVIVIPWKGTYGFRSRVVEVMAQGVPVVTSYDAVDGMNLEDGSGIVLSDSVSEMVEKTLKILRNSELADKLSEQAIEIVGKQFTMQSTYGKLAAELRNFIEGRKK